MTAAQILDEASKRGVRVELRPPDRIKFVGPASAVDVVRPLLAANKPAVLDELRRRTAPAGQSGHPCAPQTLSAADVLERAYAILRAGDDAAAAVKSQEPASGVDSKGFSLYGKMCRLCLKIDRCYRRGEQWVCSRCAA